MGDDEVKAALFLVIEVEAINDPEACTVTVTTRPAIRGPTEWTDKVRRVADHMALDVLDGRDTVVEVTEQGVHRRYRVPSRIQDGWEPVNMGAVEPRPLGHPNDRIGGG